MGAIKQKETEIILDIIGRVIQTCKEAGRLTQNRELGAILQERSTAIGNAFSIYKKILSKTKKKRLGIKPVMGMLNEVNKTFKKIGENANDERLRAIVLKRELPLFEKEQQILTQAMVDQDREQEIQEIESMVDRVTETLEIASNSAMASGNMALVSFLKREANDIRQKLGVYKGLTREE